MGHQESFNRAVTLLREARRVVVFTGAGVSAESGIDTFRDDGGLWSEFPPEIFATRQGLLHALRREPETVARFLFKLIHPVARAEANTAHRAIADLERHVPVTVVTQNVDRLHHDAGSTTVREIHGSLFEIVTTGGRFVRLLDRAQLLDIATKLETVTGGLRDLPKLARAIAPMMTLSLGGLTRPRIVLFGEPLAEPDWTQAGEDARACDLMLIVGTSGLVQPAASLPEVARDQGAKLITIDPTATLSSDVWLEGSACEWVLPLVQSLDEDR